MKQLKDEILVKLRKMLITRLNLEKKEEEITEETILFGPGENSLGLDSVDGLEIVVGVGNEFGVTITEEEGPEVLKNVGTLVEYILRHYEITYQ